MLNHLNLVAAVPDTWNYPSEYQYIVVGSRDCFGSPLQDLNTVELQWLEPRWLVTMDESNTFLSPQGFPPNTIYG